MKREVALARAHSAIGHGCIYKLGRGGKNPHAAVPWDDDLTCDCSGFAIWTAGISRFIWLDTFRIHSLAQGEVLFTAVRWVDAKPGDFVNYPDAGGKQGHVGVVSVTDEMGPVKVIHCSTGNWKRGSDAIAETGPEIWVGRGIIARAAVLED